MQLSNIDIAIIVVYLLFALVVGVLFSRRAGKSVEDFFLGGRKLPWYLAGISMVATTFAADTPLLVSGLVATSGVSGNWLWWNMLIGGMLTVFFFSHLWRRAEVLTELEFIEFRYSGPVASFLRGFKAIYLGVFLNVLVIGWVNYAMIKILSIFFGLDATTAFWTVAGMMLFVAVYSSLSGLLGVAITDSVQFVLAMLGCIILAYVLLDLPEVGGMAGLRAKLPEWRFAFLPAIGGSHTQMAGEGVLAISTGAFISHALVQWWASWYPGSEPGGGGYVAQRMMSTKTPEDATKSVLLFQVLHYAARPWPWVIVGLCALVLFPDLGPDQAEDGFVLAMREYAPNGIRGLLVASFLAAYMSTISTQLNWGASFITNDLYTRFIDKGEGDNRKSVRVGRIATVAIMVIAAYATSHIESIEGTFRFLIACGAGMGLVLILRWYWWRINAEAELVATLAPFAGYLIGVKGMKLEDPLIFITAFTTLCWIVVMYLTKPTDIATLQAFRKKVQPGGMWRLPGEEKSKSHNGGLGRKFVLWVLATVMVLALLIGSGKLLFLEYQTGGVAIVVAIISGTAMFGVLKRGYSLSDAESEV